MKINFFLILFIYCFTQTLISQEKSEVEESDIFSVLSEETDSTGLVNIYQDLIIEELVLHHIERNKKINGIPGYRINIFSQSGQYARQKWVAVKDTFDKYYPDIPSYGEYQEPNFKIYVGDFRTKVDALIFHKYIQRIYPKSFIVNARINYPKINEE